MPDPRPPLPGKIEPEEQRTVDALTNTRIYRYIGLANARNFGRLVVLTPTA